MKVMVEEMRSKFDTKIREIERSKYSNSCFITTEKYKRIIGEVKNAKAKLTKKTPKDYHRLKQYDILTVDGEEKLVYPPSLNDPCNVKFYLTIEELFDIIHRTHVAIGHHGRNKMMGELNKKFKNVTSEMVMDYLKLCEVCKMKKKKSSTKTSEESEVGLTKEASGTAPSNVSTPEVKQEVILPDEAWPEEIIEEPSSLVSVPNVASTPSSAVLPEIINETLSQTMTFPDPPSDDERPPTPPTCSARKRNYREALEEMELKEHELRMKILRQKLLNLEKQHEEQELRMRFMKEEHEAKMAVLRKTADPAATAS